LAAVAELGTPADAALPGWCAACRAEPCHRAGRGARGLEGGWQRDPRHAARQEGWGQATALSSASLSCATTKVLQIPEILFVLKGTGAAVLLRVGSKQGEEGRRWLEGFWVVGWRKQTTWVQIKLK